jgi:hypothetical protein
MQQLTCTNVANLQEYCRKSLEVAYSASKPTARHMELLGHGNGFTFEASPFCSYAKRAGVHVMFAGEVSEWPGIDAVSLAHNGAFGFLVRTCAACSTGHLALSLPSGACNRPVCCKYTA